MLVFLLYLKYLNQYLNIFMSLNSEIGWTEIDTWILTYLCPGPLATVLCFSHFEQLSLVVLTVFHLVANLHY